jgi:hypothetical protein
MVKSSPLRGTAAAQNRQVERRVHCPITLSDWDWSAAGAQVSLTLLGGVTFTHPFAERA